MLNRKINKYDVNDIHNKFYLLVAPNVYDNCCRRHALVSQLLCNIRWLNLMDYLHATFEFHSLVPMQIHLECSYNDPTKIVPKMCHHLHLFAILFQIQIIKRKMKTSNRELI